MTDQQLPLTGQDPRDRAIARLKQKRDSAPACSLSGGQPLFDRHLGVHRGGLLWPAFPLFGWGIGLVLNAWDVYWRKPVSEDRIRHEMERMT